MAGAALEARLTRSDVSLALLGEFSARGIEIPYPQREVRLVRAADKK